jgi:hypothetical protein
MSEHMYTIRRNLKGKSNRKDKATAVATLYGNETWVMKIQ